MNALVIPDISEALHHKLCERAKVNHRSIEAEALSCLEAVVETDDALLDAVPAGAWTDIEQSVCATIQDRGTPLTATDFQRYQELARGRNRP